MKKRRFILLFVGIILGMTVVSNAQSKTSENLSPKEKYELEYKKRITKKYLYGRYIPSDILDACKELTRLSDPRAIEKFKSNPEDTVVKKLHFGLGKWVMHNWGLQDGSRYGHYFKSKGLSYPDDMVKITLMAWHRSLNDVNLDFKVEVDKLVALRKKEWAERKKKRKVIKLGPKK